MIGTGIFATPSGIFALSGSVGLALFMWVAGTLIAAAGLLVYIEFGTAIPRNGGEKNYLEFVYRKPRFLATGFFTSYVMLLGWAGESFSWSSRSLIDNQVATPSSLANISLPPLESMSTVSISEQLVSPVSPRLSSFTV